MIFDVYLHFRERPECRWMETYYAPLLRTQLDAEGCAHNIVDTFNDHLSPDIPARAISRVFVKTDDDGNEGHAWEKNAALTKPGDGFVVLQCAMCKRKGKLFTPTQFLEDMSMHQLRYFGGGRTKCEGPNRTQPFLVRSSLIGCDYP